MLHGFTWYKIGSFFICLCSLSFFYASFKLFDFVYLFLPFIKHIYILQWTERFHIVATNMKLFHGKCMWPHHSLPSPKKEINALLKSSLPTHTGYHSSPAKHLYSYKYTLSSSQFFLLFNHQPCVEHVYVIFHKNSTKGAPSSLFFMIHNLEIYFKLSVKRKSRIGTLVCHFVALAKSSNKWR